MGATSRLHEGGYEGRIKNIGEISYGPLFKVCYYRYEISYTSHSITTSFIIRTKNEQLQLDLINCY